MSVSDDRQAKLQAVLQQLKAGKTVQNSQLQKLLGDDAFERILEDWREQLDLRDTLKNKPDEIVEYSKRLQAATFNYSKAEKASNNMRHPTARKLYERSEAQFAELAEYLSEIIARDGSLELWFDRNVHFDISNKPSNTPSDFPRVVTSSGLKNEGGGHLDMKHTKRQIKINVVERELNALANDDLTDDEVLAAIAKKTRLMKRR